MTITELGAIGEFIGAFAVLATLIYLALQIRNNTEATRAQIHQARSDQAQEYFLFLAGSPDVAEIMDRVFEGGTIPNLTILESLTSVERRRLMYFCIANQQRLENMFFQFKSGYLNEETYSRTLLPVSRAIPLWEALGILQYTEGEFSKELDRIRREVT